MTESLALMIEKGKAGTIAPDRTHIADDPMTEEELLELAAVEEEDLRAALRYCRVRVFNGTPLIAMTLDEMQRSYMALRWYNWRARIDVFITKKRRRFEWAEQAIHLIHNLAR